MIGIPFPAGTEALADFSFTQLFDGTLYTMAFKWNVRSSRWYLTMFDSTGQKALVGGVPIILILPMWYNLSSTAKPAGALIFQDTSGGQPQPPGFGELGGRVVANYIPKADLGLA